MKIYADFYAESLIYAEFALKNARRAISIFAARFLRLNSPACRGRSREKDNASSPLSAPSVHTPRAYYTAASPALPAVPGCCRTHPRRRCSRWQEWCHPRTGLPLGWCPYGKQFCHSRILQDLIFGVRSLEPMPSSRCRISRFFICLRVSARFLHGFCTVGVFHVRLCRALYCIAISALFCIR